MAEPGWTPLTMDQLLEVVRLLRPSREEEQLTRHVRRECLAADLLERCQELGTAVPLATARAVAASWEQHEHEHRRR